MIDRSVSIALGEMEDTVGVKGNGNGGEEHGIEVVRGIGNDGRDGCQGNHTGASVAGGPGYVGIRRGNTVKTARNESWTMGQSD